MCARMMVAGEEIFIAIDGDDDISYMQVFETKLLMPEQQ